MEFANKLASFDTCLISDSCDMLGIRGNLNGIIQLTPGINLAGKVATLQLTSKKSGKNKVHLGANLIDSSSIGDIIIVAYDDNANAGTWGGLLTAGAIRNGIKGVISQGLIRDISFCRNNSFSVFAAGTTAVSARNRIFEESFNKTIKIGGVIIDPGDYVLADENGIIIIKDEMINEVIQAAEKLQSKENELLKLIKDGLKISSVLDKKYENLLNNE